MASNLHPLEMRLIELVLRFERKNEMLGLGLLGTIIVILVIVWLARRV